RWRRRVLGLTPQATSGRPHSGAQKDVPDRLSVHGRFIMPDDFPAIGEPSTRIPPAQGAGGSGVGDLERIRRLQDELLARERELSELRSQLRAIHTSDTWAILRTLSQLRQALAPHGTRRARLARRCIRGLRRLKKVVARIAQSTGSAIRSLGRREGNRIQVDPATGQTYA